jgi:hypothetical protein
MLSFIVAVLLMCPCLAIALPVPDTGQTRCYDDSGNELIPWPSPGQDFYGQDAHYAINLQSYTKLDENGNDLPDDEPWPWAMVRDNVTGLIWEIKTNDNSIHNLEFMYHWSYGITFVDSLNNSRFGGLTNWRVPTVKELAFLINRNRIDPTIDTAYFPYTLYNYWSCWADNPDYAWGVCFCNGRIGTYNIDLGVSSFQAVSGEQSYNDFVDNGDGTVTDVGSGLMWQKDPPSEKYTWHDALAYCANLTLAGYCDWRLPDANELISIAYEPGGERIFFTSAQWTSTTYMYDTSKAVFVNFGDYTYHAVKTHLYNFRAVRGGQSEPVADRDCDDIIDQEDNCPDYYNQGQDDSDLDGTGDVCDNCLETYNPVQEDTDNDGMGDACDPCPHDYNNDVDEDGVCGDIDNCPGTPNGLNLGTCANISLGVIQGTGRTCTNGADCGTNEICELFQFDINDNGVGDVCECYADVNCSAKVDLADLVIMKGEFLQSCPCQADCNGDYQVNLGDLVIMKEQFCRSGCPACP